MLKILKTFYKFYARRKYLFYFFIFIMVLGSVLYSLAPYFYKLLVEAAAQSNFSYFSEVLIIFIVVQFIAMAVSTFSHYIGDLLLIDSAVDARVSVFKQLQDLDFYFHTQKSTGSLISAIKRGDGAFFTFQNVLHFNLLGIFTNFVVMVFFFWSLDFRIVAISVASFLISLVISKFLVSINMKVRRLFNEEEDKISGIIVDNITNYDTVKLFARESWETKRLVDSFESWKKGLMKYANTFRLIGISIGSLINASMFFLLFFSLNLTNNSLMGLGDLVLVIGFSSSFYPRLWDFVFSLRDLAKNYTDIEKYFAILNQITKVKDPINPVEKKSVKGKIHFKNVWFSYKDGKKDAVKNINLTVKPGESIALVGKSGSGKSTLIKLLLRFYDVTKGSITIDGINVKKFKKSQLRSLTGVVPQEPVLFNNSIAFNIGYAKGKVNFEDIKKASKLALIDEFINQLPDKYETIVGERGVKLSGGQKQRVAIARMILSDPDIVIFDEATSQLDSESERLIQDAFWKVAKGKTAVIIAHRLSTAMRADRIIVLDDGRVKEEGTHKSLLKQTDSLYARFWKLQTVF